MADENSIVPDQPDRHSGDGEVLGALEPDQLSGAVRQRYGRRQLSAGILIVMWGLRIYAILMVLAVIYSVMQAIHTGRLQRVG